MSYTSRKIEKADRKAQVCQKRLNFASSVAEEFQVDYKPEPILRARGTFTGFMEENRIDILNTYSDNSITNEQSAFPQHNTLALKKAIKGIYPTLDTVEDFITKVGLQDSRFYKRYLKFKRDYDSLQLKYNNDYFNFLDSCFINRKLSFDDYLIHIEYINSLIADNLLLKDDAQKYIKSINSIYSADKEQSNAHDKYQPTRFDKYQYGNWRQHLFNNHLNTIFENGGYVFVTKNFKILYRATEEAQTVQYTIAEAEVMIGKDLGIDLYISKKRKIKKKPDDEDEEIAVIYIHELITLYGEKFNPFILQEYYEENGVWYKNIFKPTKYMKLHGKMLKEPTAILKLFYHIVNYDNERFEVFINWISYYFKKLIKPKMAMILTGTQGGGKGILFEEIFEPLLGKEYVIQAGNTSLKSNFKAGFLRNKLLYNFNEISSNTSSYVKNFLKQLITDSFIFEEERYTTINEPIELLGIVLITTNNSVPIEIESGDRRFTVMTTGNKLTEANFLGYGSYDNLVAHIRAELEDFALYMKNYDVDIDMANNPYHTPEKDVIINATRDSLKDLHEAIIGMDISFFDMLQDTHPMLYADIVNDFKHYDRINRANITKAYNKLYQDNLSPKKLLSKLRAFQPYHLYQDSNKIHIGSAHYYKLQNL